MDLDAAAYESVLAHEDDRVAAEALADVLELVGANIVGASDEHLAVLVQQRAQLLVVHHLLLRLRQLYRHLALLSSIRPDQQKKKITTPKAEATKDLLLRTKTRPKLRQG